MKNSGTYRRFWKGEDLTPTFRSGKHKLYQIRRDGEGVSCLLSLFYWSINTIPPKKLKEKLCLSFKDSFFFSLQNIVWWAVFPCCYVPGIIILDVHVNLFLPCIHNIFGLVRVWLGQMVELCTKTWSPNKPCLPLMQYPHTSKVLLINSKV